MDNPLPPVHDRTIERSCISRAPCCAVGRAP